MSTLEPPARVKTGRFRALAGAHTDGAWPQAGHRHALYLADPAVSAAVPDRL